MGSVAIVAPELALFMTSIVSLLFGVGGNPRTSRLATPFALIGFAGALAAAAAGLHSGEVTEAFSRTFLFDPVSQLFKVVLTFCAMMAALLGSTSREVARGERSEIYALIALGTLGMCVMASAVHFLLLLLAFETAGMSCYVLAAFKRRSDLSSEAGVKLFVHGGLTTVLFAFGIVMLYGLGNSFNILDMRAELAAATRIPPGYLWVAFGLIFTAVAARMAAFPFHFLAPDVVEGAPAPVSAFFSVASASAAVAVALRLCIHILSAKSEHRWTHLAGFEWPELIAGIAAATMTAGNLAALHQTNLKRLLGYAAIAQTGFALMGLAVSNHDGVAALLFSLATSAIMTMGAFFVVQRVSDQAGSERLGALRGLIWSKPFEGAALCVFLLGLAGVPPLVGFVGRFYVLGVVVREKMYWLAIAAAINWVIGFTYYLTMVREIFAREGRLPENDAVGGVVAPIALGALLAPTVILGVYWDPVMQYIIHALNTATW
jgi:NADH-quinone oxidoreductase subunit N